MPLCIVFHYFLKCPILLSPEKETPQLLWKLVSFQKVHFCSDIDVANNCFIVSFQLGRAKDECDGTEDTVQQ